MKTLDLIVIMCVLSGSMIFAEEKVQEQKISLPYTIVDTAQERCYAAREEIAYPKAGAEFFGQDAQFTGNTASYVLSADGLTVCDKTTGLTWQRSPDTDGNGKITRSDKLTLTEAQALPAKLNAAKFGGFNDWRLPSIKELYSLFDGRGTDPSPTSKETSELTPFIDTKSFKFVYGDTSTGERVIDSQYASSTKYAGKSPRGGDKLFGVNFADGRIKGYDLEMPGGSEKKFFVQCVRGNPKYGKNDFKDNSDGTITDKATGLMWSKTDSTKGMTWQDALAWVQKKNEEKYLGHDDWRMPNVKELQSIVDYSRSPDTSQSAAIDPIFKCTQITNEAGKADYPFYWTGTTHASPLAGGSAMYIAFGRASGWLSPHAMAGGAPDRGKGKESADAEYEYVDIHGAGAQRSDPKIGDPAKYPHGHGPQGDVIRIYNFVRCVRGGTATPKTEGPAINKNSKPETGEEPPMDPESGNGEKKGGNLIKRLDKDGDGKISKSEFDGPPEHFSIMDSNKDGYLSDDELRKGPPPRQTGKQGGE